MVIFQRNLFCHGIVVERDSTPPVTGYPTGFDLLYIDMPNTFDLLDVELPNGFGLSCNSF